MEVLELHPEQVVPSEQKRYCTYRCAVRGCKTTFEDVIRAFRLHKLLEDEDYTKMWLHNTKVKMAR